MSERAQGTQTPAPGTRAEEPVSGWAIGLMLFAGVMMIMAGLFGIVTGMAALIENNFFVIGREYVFEFDVTTWGWIHLLVGIVIAVAGFFVFSGQPWARGVGIACAALNALINFMFLPYYPVWSILIIALDVAVIWALAVYSRRTAESYWGR